MVQGDGVEQIYRVPSRFNYNVGQHECLPCVCLRSPFSSFVQRPHDDEVGHDLVDQLDDHKQRRKSIVAVIIVGLKRLANRIDGMNTTDTTTVRAARKVLSTLLGCLLFRLLVLSQVAADDPSATGASFKSDHRWFCTDMDSIQRLPMCSLS